MSVFAGHDISLNKYHYVFYSFSKSEPNTLKAQFYDSGQNLLGTQNISFSQRDIPAMLTFLENSQSNPYALGKSPSGFRNMDIAFSGIYKKTLKDSQQQSLMTYVNKTFKNVYSNAVTVYEVKVNGSMKYMIDDVEQPNLLALQTGIYVFDQSDSSNSDHLLKFRNLSDSPTPYTTNVTYEGTPGTPNSYSIIDVTQDTPDLEYYCEVHTVSMYGEFKTLTDLSSYRVKVETNVLGDTVFALSPPGTNEYYNQIDVSFGAGSKFLFDVSDIGSYSLVFGTEVDVASTIQTQYFSQTGDVIILSIPSEYSGNSLVYFEDTSAGMGYVEASLTSANIPIIFSGVTEPKFYWDFRTTTPLTNGSETYVEDIMDVSNTNLKAVAKGSLSFNSLTGPTFNSTDYIQIDPFSFGGKCSVEVYYYVTRFTSWQRVLCFANTTSLTNRYLIGSAFNTGTNFGVSLQNDSSVYESTGSTPTTTSLNTWYQAVVTLDENGSLEAYVNKVDQGYNTTITLPEQQRIYNLVGKANTSTVEGMYGQIGYVRIWQDHVLTTSEISNLYDTRSIPYGFITNKGYSVTVSGDLAVFYIDGSANPQIVFSANETYLFDQSDSTNAGQQLVFGFTPDDTANILTSADGVTIMGTPGQPGAYTTFTATGETVFYYSFETPNMGYKPPTYKVKTEANILGDIVFSIKKPGESVFYTQPDLSFGAGFVGQFDVADIGSYNLVFGTEVDVSSTIQTQYFNKTGGTIILSIPVDYSGNSLKYFEDTSAGMGYAKATATMTMTTTTLNPNTFNNVTNPTFYWDFREITNNTYVTDLINGTINANAVGSLSFNNSTGPTFNSTDYIQIDPFTFGGKCSVEVYFKVTNFSSVWQRVVDFGAKFNIYSRYGGDSPYTIGVNLWNGTAETSQSIKGSTTINADTWYHVVVTVDASTNANVKGYLNANTGTPEISSSSPSSIAFPNTDKRTYLVGKDNHGQTNQCMIGQIAYVRIWQDHVLTQTEITNLYNTKDYEVFVDVEVEVDVEPASYTVDVSNSSIFRLDSGDGNGFVEKYPVAFNNNTTYIFDQSHESNANNTLVIGTFDVSSSIVTSGLTIMGTPGQPGAYTKYVSDGSTVHYFSYQTENMGTASPPPNITDYLYVHYDFELPLYDANGTAYSTDVTGGSDEYANQSIRFYNKAYDSSTNSDISYNMYVIRGNLVSDTFKVGSSSFKTFESPYYGASRVGDYSFRLNSTKGYSICFWMKEVAKNFTASQFLPLCAFGNSGSGGGFFQMEYNDSTFKVNNDDTSITYDISSLPITDWNHIAFTMSPDGPVITWKLYINGSLVNTKTDGNYLTSVNPVSGYPTDSVFIFDISSKPGIGINNGFIDDFRFYKTELIQAQVSAVYGKGNPGSP